MCQSKKEENPLPNLVGKSEAHPSSLSHSLSLSLDSLSHFMNNTPNLSLSLTLSSFPLALFTFLVDSSPGQQCLRLRAGSLPAGSSLSLSPSPSLPHSLPSLYYLSLSRPLSLTFRHNSHSYMKMHGGSSLSHYNLFFGMTGRESERKSY